MRIAVVIVVVLALIGVIAWYALAPNTAPQDPYIDSRIDILEMEPGESPRLESKTIEPDVISERQEDENPAVDIVIDDDELDLDDDADEDEDDKGAEKPND